MNRVFVLGLSHKTAPVEVRERFSVSDDELAALLKNINELPNVSGVFAASTCNRFEVYASSEDLGSAQNHVRDWLKEHFEAKKDLDRYMYSYEDDPAIRHLFRVASSLDSMVVGEAQILGQVRSAYAIAGEIGSLDKLLNRCITRALRVAKQVRTETGIARHPVSVPQVSVELARKIFGDLTGKSVLIVGAGKMSEVAARNLLGQGVDSTHVANRSAERALELAKRLDAQPHLLDEVPDLLAEVDIVISSTGAKGYVIDKKMVKSALKVRRYRPLFMIDIAVPRDIDPKVSRLSNVYLFDIDDLEKVVDANLGERRKEAREGETLVAKQAERFSQSLEVDRVTPTIVGLRRKLTSIKEQEIERALKSLGDLSDRDKKVVNKLANTLVNRILHQPSVAIKRSAENGEADEVIKTVQTLFDLPDEDDGK